MFLYNIANEKLIQHFNISFVFIQFHFLKNIINDMKSIKKIIRLNINFLNHKNKEICMYIFNKTLDYAMLLELFWIKKNDVWINAKNKRLCIKKPETKIHQQNKKITVECHSISTIMYAIWMKKVKKNKNKKNHTMLHYKHDWHKKKNIKKKHPFEKKII